VELKHQAAHLEDNHAGQVPELERVRANTNRQQVELRQELALDELKQASAQQLRQTELQAQLAEVQASLAKLERSATSLELEDYVEEATAVNKQRSQLEAALQSFDKLLQAKSEAQQNKQQQQRRLESQHRDQQAKLQELQAEQALQAQTAEDLLKALMEKRASLAAEMEAIHKQMKKLQDAQSTSP
ncbi:MAG: hypothetical protein MI861_17940, partial [Pirellulales bacterium]|nr:hypothetical protein [Pirellulales bacterium]